MGAEAPWGISFSRFGREHRLIWLEIGLTGFISLWLGFFVLATSPELALVYSLLLMVSAAIGVFVGFLSGRQILSKTQTMGFLPWWGRRFGPRGSYLGVLLVVSSVVVMFVLMGTVGLRSPHRFASMIGVGSSFVIGLILGHALGLIGFEFLTRTSLWYRAGFENRTTLLGEIQTRIFYARPRGYRPEFSSYRPPLRKVGQSDAGRKT